ncbi:MAG: GNAT family N-acetyltransferase [Rhodobacter sp.]|nr:GNAT family N-acetyltransferase [Rhodobacter sp.]
MFRLHKRVFADRLGWDVKVTDGRETDLFDSLDPAHIVSVSDRGDDGGDDGGDVVGCMRLLQTTGPHMLADVFSSILDGEPPLRSSTVWEATRFCLDPQQLSRGRHPRLFRDRGECLCAAGHDHRRAIAAETR